jgi:hypothetical protein
MHPTHILALAAAVGLGGCAVRTGGPDSAPQDNTAAAPSAATAGSVTPPLPSAVTVRGLVLGTTAMGIGGVQVLRIPLDPYLTPILSTQTDTQGAFALDGVAGDAREWFVFDRTGYARLFQAIDTTLDGRQSAPSVTLLSDTEAAGLAQTFGVKLDPDKSVIRVPVTITVGGEVRQALGSEFQVTFQPPLDVPVHYVDGGAIAFNVVAYNSYQATVLRDGRVCAPASHPTFVATDGSVVVRPMSGCWTVAPTMACE